MNHVLLAVLFTALFVIGVYPVLFVQPFGSAGAGVTAGFLLLMDNFYHVAALSAIGLLCAILGGELVLILPLITLLMLVTGALTEMNEGIYQALHVFILGAIILFSLCIGLLRKKFMLVYITPVCIWAFFTGGDIVQHVPQETTPLFFLLGAVVGSALFLAIGITLGMVLSDTLREWLKRFKMATAFATFLSLF